MKIIQSLQNPLIKKYHKLKQKKYRKQEKLFLVEGKNLVKEAKKARLLKVIFTSNSKYEGILVTQKIIDYLATTKTPGEVIGVCQMQKAKQNLGNRVLALENIQDPGNLGTLIRTARAFGWDSVLISGVDKYNDKVIRATQGAIFRINVVQTNNIIDSMTDYIVIAAVPSKKLANAKTFDEIKSLSAKVMLVLGNESSGLSKKIISGSKYRVYIPVQFESLNVAQAGAILLNQYKKASKLMV